MVWNVQGREFLYNLKTLKLAGSDMVLGVNWMTKFGPINFDYANGCIRFRNNNEVGDLKSEIQNILSK